MGGAEPAPGRVSSTGLRLVHRHGPIADRRAAGRGTVRDMDTLDIVAASNGGYFTTAQARECGFGPRDLERSLREQVIHRVRRGTYVFKPLWDALRPQDRHVIVVKSVVRGMRGDVAVAGVSACALRGLDVWGHDLSNVHVIRLDRGAGRREAGVVHHEGVLGEDDIEMVDDLPAVRLDLALCQAGAVAGLEAGVVLYDSGLRRGGISKEELELRAERMAHVRGTRTVRFGIRLADGRSESVGESRNRFLFFRFGIPKPELQYPVRDSTGVLIGITDFGWELYCHLGEFDGLMKYRRALNGDQDPEQVMISEKAREDAMRAERKGMTRTIWRELDDRVAAGTAARTWAGLEQSRKLYAKNRVTIPL